MVDIGTAAGTRLRIFRNRPFKGEAVEDMFGQSGQVEVRNVDDPLIRVNVYFVQHTQRSTPGGEPYTAIQALGRLLNAHEYRRPMLVDWNECEELALRMSGALLAAEVEYEKHLSETQRT